MNGFMRKFLNAFLRGAFHGIWMGMVLGLAVHLGIIRYLLAYLIFGVMISVFVHVSDHLTIQQMVNSKIQEMQGSEEHQGQVEKLPLFSFVMWQRAVAIILLWPFTLLSIFRS